MAVEFRHERIKSLSNNRDTDLSIAKMRWKMLARVSKHHLYPSCPVDANLAPKPEPPISGLPCIVCNDCFCHS